MPDVWPQLIYLGLRWSAVTSKSTLTGICDNRSPSTEINWSQQQVTDSISPGVATREFLVHVNSMS